MRVLLLNPNFTLKPESRDEFSFFPPLGLGYLAALLEQDDHTVGIIDLNLSLEKGDVVQRRQENGHYRFGYTDAEIKRMIAEFAPDLVGVSSIFTSFHHDAIRVCGIAKEAVSTARTVLGGPNATMVYADAIEEPVVDIVVRGEGENPFRALVNALASSGPIDDIAGLVYHKPDGQLHDGGMAEQVRELDDLPLPAYHLMEMDFYTRSRERNFAYCKNFPIGHMITSRGCPYRCIFCSTRNFFERYRANSPERVIEEIRFLQERYGVREIHFHDDAFLIHRKRTKRICELLIDEGIDVSWQISQGVNINLLSKELLSLMKQSGMYRLGLPIESGSARTLAYIRKRADLNHAREMIAAANELGVFTHANFIIGFPHETAEEIAETHKFAATCGVDFLKILVCQPLAGAELYDVYQAEGLLESAGWSSTYTSSEYNTIHFTAAQLNDERLQILRSFQRHRLKRALSPRGFCCTVLPKISGDWQSFRYFVRLVYLSSRAMTLRLNAGH